MSTEVRTVLLAVGMAMAGAGLVLSICDIALTVSMIIRTRRKNKKSP